jgi:hypothetical protein
MPPASKADEILEPNRHPPLCKIAQINPRVPYRPSRSSGGMTSLFAIGASALLSWRSVVSKRDSDDGDRRFAPDGRAKDDLSANLPPLPDPWNGKMSIIYVGCAAVIVLAVLGLLGITEDIAGHLRGRRDGQRRR